MKDFVFFPSLREIWFVRFLREDVRGRVPFVTSFPLFCNVTFLPPYDFFFFFSRGRPGRDCTSSGTAAAEKEAFFWVFWIPTVVSFFFSPDNGMVETFKPFQSFSSADP